MSEITNSQILLLLILIVISLSLGGIYYHRRKVGGIRQRSERDLEEINRALVTSQRINKIILQSLNFDDVVQKISDTIPNELFFVTGVVAVIEKVKRTIRRVGVSSTKEASEAVSALRVPFNKIEISLDDPNNFMARAVREKKGLITEDIYDVLGPVLTHDEANKIQNLMGTKTTVVYPIYGGREGAIGVFVASTKKKKEDLSEYDYAMIQSFVDGVGIAMEHAMLYSNLEKTSEQLQEANIKLKEVDKLKDEFVSLASHELRTPMTIISSYLWLMLNKDNASSLSEKQKMYLDRAYISTQRLINLVNDMLNVSRIESGRLTLAIKPTDIAELVNSVYVEILPKAQVQKINLIFEKPQEVLPKVQADPEKIEQVLINLIGNSLKFTKEQGLIKISIANNPLQKTVTVTVLDDGKGINKEDIPKLFQKFGMVGNNYLVKQNTQGTGLGLYLSKSIIELHGGKIWVESEGEGKGSKFSFTLKTVDSKVS
ncbi:MAG: GAF domain-containing sensor histidine kinase [Candidatus Levybacteria bacterium]|nr:GAF domain-containing sensor histidine kinase [Candidatus Levybacteria bacterium]